MDELCVIISRDKKLDELSSGKQGSLDQVQQLPPGQQWVGPDKWPFVGEREPLATAEPWRLMIHGHVGTPCEWSLEQLLAKPQRSLTMDIHCVTRWSKLGASFSGIPLTELLQSAEPLPDANFIRFVARSARSHSTSLPLNDVARLNVWLALGYEGEALPREHGGPMRILVPDRYFYKSLKWVVEIELLSDDQLGYWEQEAGYHNHADPWREERFIASNLTRQQTARLIESRDFRGQSLLGFAGRGRDLRGLRAEAALLRNADFRECNLRDARFGGANLSNARFAGSDLRGASFDQADLEGADFCGADLRGADLRALSLFGVSFIGPEPDAAGARMDAETRWNPEQFEDLVPRQIEFLKQQRT